MKGHNNFDGTARLRFWPDRPTVGKRAINNDAFASGSTQVPRLVH